MSHFSFWKQILSYLFLSPMLTYKTFELKHIQIHGHSKTRIRWLIAAQIYKVLWNKRSNLIDHLFAISRCIMWSVKCAFYRKISLLASIGMSIVVWSFWIGWFNFNSLGGIYILFSTKSLVDNQMPNRWTGLFYIILCPFIKIIFWYCRFKSRIT